MPAKGQPCKQAFLRSAKLALSAQQVDEFISSKCLNIGADLIGR